MESSDIRESYDFDGKEKRIAQTLLDNCPPLWKGAQSSSELDCLIVLLRRIYSCFLTTTKGITKDLGWISTSEAKNPILGHAWHVFGDSPEDVSRATKDREKLEEALTSLSINPSASFEDLCTSTLMNETFWAQDVFCLTRVPFDAVTGERPDLSPDEIVELSTLELDRSKTPGAVLQDVVDESFGLRTWKGTQLALIPSNPWIVRVDYRADSNGGESLDINTFKQMHLPIWR